MFRSDRSFFTLQLVLIGWLKLAVPATVFLWRPKHTDATIFKLMLATPAYIYIYILATVSMIGNNR